MLRRRMRHRLYKALRGDAKGASFFSALGYSLDDLKSHLERQFLPGMSWANMGQWHLDHILPLSKFDIERVGDEQFQLAWAMSNLRPLWAKDNIRKAAKVEVLL